MGAATLHPSERTAMPAHDLRTERPYDLLAMGRVGVDLYPLQHGVTLDEVRTFEKFLGGSAANVTVAAARHGRRSALISATSDDAFGRFVHRQLLQLGVDDAFVATLVGGAPTPVTFCEIMPPDHFPIWFYRYPTAPDLMISADSLPLQAIRDARVFWSTLTGLSQEPSRSAHLAAWEERGRRVPTVLDLDYRPGFWDDPVEAREQVARGLREVTIAIGTVEECELATGESDPDAAARSLLASGVDLAVVKQGPRGVLGVTASERVQVNAYPSRSSTHGRGRRPRGRPRARPARGLGPRARPALRQRRRGDRRVAGRVLDGDADDGRGAAAAVRRRGGRRGLVSRSGGADGRAKVTGGKEKTRPRWSRRRTRPAGAGALDPVIRQGRRSPSRTGATHEYDYDPATLKNAGRPLPVTSGLHPGHGRRGRRDRFLRRELGTRWWGLVECSVPPS